MEYENVWDILGLILAGSAIASAVSTFIGIPIYVETMTIPQLFAHFVLMVAGFTFTEGGVLKIYTRTLDAFKEILV